MNEPATRRNSDNLEGGNCGQVRSPATCQNGSSDVNRLNNCCEIDDLYNDVAQILCDSSVDTIAISAAMQVRAAVERNDSIESFHDDARSNYFIWRNCEKPRQGPTFENMKLCRARFKRAYSE